MQMEYDNSNYHEQEEYTEIVCLTDFKGCILTANLSFKHLVACKSDDLFSMSIFSFIRDVDKENVKQILNNFLAGQDPHESEIHFSVSILSNQLIIRWNIFKYENVLYWTGQRKNSAKKDDVRSLENKAIETLANFGTWSYDLETQQFEWSDGFYRILGLQPGSITAGTNALTSFLIEHDNAVIGKHFEEAKSGNSLLDFEHPIIRSDGQYRWVHVKSTYLKDEHEKVSKLFGLMIDKTEEKYGQKLIENNTKRYESLTAISNFQTDFENNLLELILSECIRLTDSKRGYIFTKKGKTNEFILLAQNGIQISTQTSDFNLIYSKIENLTNHKEPIILNDFNFIPQYNSAEQKYNDNNMMIAPVNVEDDINVIIAVAGKNFAYDEPDRIMFMLYAKSSWEIVQRRKAERMQAEEDEWLKTLVQSISDGIIATDINGYVKMMNPKAESLTGIKFEEVKGISVNSNLRIYDQSGQVQDIFKNVKGRKSVQLVDNYYLISRNNKRAEIDISISVITQSKNTISGFVLVLHDVTEKRNMERELKFLTYRDKLTGLYNRRYFEEEIERLDVARNIPLSIIVGDVNGLKLINDAFGHIPGDNLLKAAARAMQSACRKEDIIARWGGDEFSILLPKTDAKEAERISERIHIQAGTEMVCNMSLSISLGYATKTTRDENVIDVLKNADQMMYKSKLLESRSIKSRTVNSILTTLHEIAPNEEQHSKNVSIICGKMGTAMGLDKSQVTDLRVLGRIHDIGKISVDSKILNKNGTLTQEEYNTVKRHSEKGCNIISNSPELSYLSTYVLAHHERWDGKGYPNGAKGEEIPLISRILTIADAFEAMTNDRPYRKAMTIQQAIEEIRKNSGSQFDPHIAQLFIDKVVVEENH